MAHSPKALRRIRKAARRRDHAEVIRLGGRYRYGPGYMAARLYLRTAQLAQLVAAQKRIVAAHLITRPLPPARFNGGQKGLPQIIPPTYITEDGVDL